MADFLTTVVDSMPRPQHVKDMVEAMASHGHTDDARAEFQASMDAAVPFVVQPQEQAGVDIVSDGEWRRMSYIGVIADVCNGFQVSVPETDGERQTWHVVTEELSPRDPGVFAREAALLKQHTRRGVKVAMPLPYLLGERLWDAELSRDAYPTRRDFTEALVPVLRDELVALRDEGVAIAQFDDPHLCLFVDPRVRERYEDPTGEMAYCVDALNRVVDGVEGVTTALHLCRRNKGRAGWVGEGGYGPILPALSDLEFDSVMLEFAMTAAGDVEALARLPERFTVGLGCVDCRSENVDTPSEIVERVERALAHVPAERVMLHPDCSFAPGSAAETPLDEAYAKLRNLAEAARTLREAHSA